LRSFIDGKLLHMSDFAGGGIMAGSRPVAILAGGRSSEAMAAGSSEQTRHRKLTIDQTAVVQSACGRRTALRMFVDVVGRVCRDCHSLGAVTVTHFFAAAALAFGGVGVFYCDFAQHSVGIEARLFENRSAQSKGEFGTKGHEDFTLAPLKLV
jgi:hypothetical protein